MIIIIIIIIRTTTNTDKTLKQLHKKCKYK